MLPIEDSFTIRAGRYLKPTQIGLESPGVFDSRKYGQELLIDEDDLLVAYVNSATGSDANNGEIATPYATMTYAIAHLTDIATRTHIEVLNSATIAMGATDLTIPTQVKLGVFANLTFTSGKIKASLSGFNVDVALVEPTADIIIQDCNLTITHNSSAHVDYIRCESLGFTATAGSFKFYGSLLKSSCIVNFRATALIKVEFHQCTVITNITITNTSGTGLERLVDCLVVGNVTATVSFIWESGNIQGTSNLELTENVYDIDPVFDLNTYDLSRANTQYYDGITNIKSLFDSPFVGAGSIQIDNGLNRDSGAYSYDNIVREFGFGSAMPLTYPRHQDSIREKKINKTVNAQLSVNANISSSKDENQTYIELTIDLSGAKCSRQDIDYLNALELALDPLVMVNLNPSESAGLQAIRNPDTTYDAGKQTINVSGGESIRTGAVIKILGKNYLVVLSDLHGYTAKQDIYLDRPLEDQVLISTDIEIVENLEEKEYIFIQADREWSNWYKHDSTFQQGSKLTFWRKF